MKKQYSSITKRPPSIKNKSLQATYGPDYTLPQYGLGAIIGGGLGALLAPFTGGASAPIGTMLGAGADNLFGGQEERQLQPLQQPMVDPRNTQQFYNPVKAYGGPMQPNAEIEGNEVIQHNPYATPQATGQGSMQQIASDMSVAQGPTHADGGVPVQAQPGSMVVSDRLPAPNNKEYKSIANKVEMLGRKKGQLEKKFERSPNDESIKNALELTQKQIDTLIQQQEAMKQQNSEAIMQRAVKKAYGGKIPPVQDPNALDPDFMKLWNTGSYAIGGNIPKYDGIKNPSSYINNPMYNDDVNIMNNAYLGLQANSINGSINELGFSPKLGVTPQSLMTTNNTKGIPIGEKAEGSLMNDYEPKAPKKPMYLKENLMNAAQYIPDIVGMFTQKNKPMNVNEYMNTAKVNPARYDTSAEEAAALDMRNQAMNIAKEASGGDASMYSNMANSAVTGGYKNLGQIYGKAQNINAQNQMQADQINASLGSQNSQMAFQVANANQADEQAVQQMRMNAMQGLGTKISQQNSQNQQFKLLESMFPHYKRQADGSVVFNGKVVAKAGAEADNFWNDLASKAGLATQFLGLTK